METLKTHSESRPCKNCNATITRELHTYKWRGETFTTSLPELCPHCQKLEDEEEARRQWREEREKKWISIVPPLYLHSDINRFPQPLQDALETFDPSSDTGIGIRGASGTCKTRTAFQFLKKAYFAGYSVEITTSTKLASIAAGQWDDRPDPAHFSIIEDSPTIGQSNQKKLAQFARCRWLLIDDIGKEKSTDRSESALYDILEERTSSNLPTIWTLNMSAADLKRRQSKDRSTPILRRLVEFSHVIVLE